MRLLLPFLCWFCLSVLVAHADTPAAAPPPASGRVEEKTLRPVLAALANGAPAVRLQALRDLSTLLSLDAGVGRAALPRLKAILRLRGPEERAAVLAMLLRVPGPDARALWLRSLDPEVESHDAVLAAATGATRSQRTNAELARELLRAYRDKRASACRRALVLEALGWMQGPMVELVLRRPPPGEHWVEASARALAFGRRRTVKSIEPLLKLLAHESLAPRVHAWASLVDLTYQDLPVDAAAWRAWWHKQDKSALPPRPTLKAGGGAAAHGAATRYATEKPVHVPHYYDIPIPKPQSRVVFCLDASQSMYGHGIDSARRHLTRTIMDLPATHAFEIIVFNEKVMPWSKRLVQAHPVQKFLAIAYLDAVEPTSYTNLYDSVELAFGHGGRGPRSVPGARRLDAIFLLSDGAPNRGRYRIEKRVVKHIAALSKKEIPVHTIGAGEEVFPLLRAIAGETGGTFVDAFE